MLSTLEYRVKISMKTVFFFLDGGFASFHFIICRES